MRGIQFMHRGFFQQDVGLRVAVVTTTNHQKIQSKSVAKTIF